MNTPNEPPKEDRRVRYTKMVLRESLLELMAEKPLAKITPTELCRRADVNRNTFYRHYRTPEDVLQETEDELYRQVRQHIETTNPATPEAGLKAIMDTIKENQRFFTVLLSPNGNKAFIYRVIMVGREYLASDYNIPLNEEVTSEQDQLFLFIVNGFIAVLQNWIASGMKQSTAEMAHLLSALSKACLGATEKK
ncbi:TetR/AcrR family transcriptional regulator [Parvibacter caecicola]|uniref:TetR/AcrR family transcriptional regulator n=1 Tax=Parvibacter caecicola TaxID=747645 RepID=UPI00249B0F8D|nr:TetR/AcrR family transcriptional regulator [Parvibacter caecicola]